MGIETNRAVVVLEVLDAPLPEIGRALFESRMMHLAKLNADMFNSAYHGRLEGVKAALEAKAD
eukprot:549253-Alexandrium_andersonii.AAC.1